MNKLLLTILVFVAGTSFASDKICFGAGDAKGVTFLMDVSAHKVSIKFIKERGAVPAYDGDYTRKEEVVHGKDGIDYLVFFLGFTDCSQDMLVDESLLESKTKGKVKFRCRGEGFNQETYYCRDRQ